MLEETVSSQVRRRGPNGPDIFPQDGEGMTHHAHARPTICPPYHLEVGIHNADQKNKYTPFTCVEPELHHWLKPNTKGQSPPSTAWDGREAGGLEVKKEVKGWGEWIKG